MPMFKRKFKRKIKPRFQRKRKFGPTITALKAAVVPDRLIVRLPYVQQASIAQAAGVPADLQFRLNSIWDPEVAVGLGQSKPLGVNQWTAFYNRYRVIGVNVYLMTRNTNTDACYVGICANNDTGNLISEAAYEQSRTTLKMIGSTQGGHDVAVFKKYYNLANLTGRPKSAYIADDRYQAQMDADPLEAIHLHLMTQPASPALATSIHFSLKMVYLVELFDRKALAQST